MAAASPNIGDLLANEVHVFRAFAEKSYRDRKKNKVRNFAYFLREEDVNDGLSVGLSPNAAVKNLQSNEGYCRIAVGAIHSLPYGLEVRIDTLDGDHAFIRNLPLMTISDTARETAALIANELARRSEVITCDPYNPL